MSHPAPRKALTAADIRSRKGGAPLVCLPAYTPPIAQIADAECDVVLVGDSVGMVLHGLPSTLQVTLEMMILHGKAVARGLQRALMVVDMPFGSYEESPEQALRNAARLMAETGAGAVKLEGGRHMEATIRFLVARGIPVMAHIGLTPQSVNVIGGYSVQGKGADAARIRDDASAVAEAGAFSVVIEKVPAALADAITAEVAIPTIGIGAWAGCDGQVQVVSDILGLFTDFVPRHAKQYARIADIMSNAITEYYNDVKAGSFPPDKQCFSMDESLIAELERR